VKKWLDEWENNESVKDKIGKGRKKKLSWKDQSRMMHSTTANPFTTPHVLRRELQLSKVCTRSIRRQLNEAGLYGRIARKQPPFTDHHRLQ
jgi:hypothetical protein